MIRRVMRLVAYVLYFPYGGEHGAGVWTFGPILRALRSSFLRKEPDDSTCAIDFPSC